MKNVQGFWKKFEVTIPGKWLLTGEHSVIRGATAIAMPHAEFALTLQFDPTASSAFAFDPPEIAPILRDGFQAAKLEMPQVGRLSIQSTIPIGAGMGSSAALCVALTRWVSEPGGLKPSDWVTFATALENRFHGKSSGVDVAVVSAQEPLCFVRGKSAETLGLHLIPRFTFHDTGLRASTHACVSQVEAYLRHEPEKGEASDQRMADASGLAMDGLRHYDQGQKILGLEKIASAMQLAHESFLEWNLVPPEAKQLRDQLLTQGALAVKLTGAGGGGMLIALWAG